MQTELQQPLNPGGQQSQEPDADSEARATQSTASERLFYDFQNWFTTDPYAKPVSIIVANLVCVFILTFLFFLTGNLHQISGLHRFLELLWMSFGKMGGGGGMSPNGWVWPTRAVMIMAGFMKMAAFSLLVNFLGDAIDSRMESLMEGKSRVLEENFVLILGWSDKILPLVEQLCLANESEGGAPIVILADQSKPEMDAFFFDNMPHSKRIGSTIITRGGNTINPNDLDKCAATLARSIVVLSQGFDADEADAQAARAVLAVTGGLKFPPTGHVVVELRDRDNVDVVRLGISDKMCPTEDEKKRMVLPLVGADLIGRLMVQCSIEPGLAACFHDILAFEGNEFYFTECSQRNNDEFSMCVHYRFADLCFMFDDAVLLGIRLARPDDTGKYICLNPPGPTIIEDGDKLLFIAEDNDTYRPGKLHLTSCGEPPNIPEEEEQSTKTLLIGWRRDMQDMIMEVDKWVAPGSYLAILAEYPDIPARHEELIENECFIDDPDTGLKHVELEMMQGNPILRDDLVEAELHQYDAVMILTEEREGIPGLQSDSRSMVSMLLCRDIQKKSGAVNSKTGEMPILIAEILDDRTSDLVALASCNDHMVSNLLVSQGLGQMSQEIDVHPLLEDLFDPEGNEMHIKDVKRYAHEGEYLNFWEITNRARRRLEVAMGYERYDPQEGAHRIVLNPPNKDEKICWQQGDRIVVLSED